MLHTLEHMDDGIVPSCLCDPHSRPQTQQTPPSPSLEGAPPSREGGSSV